MIRARIKLFGKILAPFLLVYAAYFLFMEQFIFPLGSPKSTRIFVAMEHARLYKNKAVDFLVMGDSTALYGIDPAQLSADSLSVSMVASPVYSTWRMLQSLEDIKIKRAIVMTQTFIYDHYDLDVWGVFVPNKVYLFKDVMNLFCMEKISECSQWERFKLGAKYFLARAHLTSHALRQLWEWMESDGRRFHNMHGSFLDMLKRKRGFFEKDRTALASSSIFLAPFREHFSRPVVFVPAAEKIYLSRILELAQQRGIKIYFVIAPFAATQLGVSTLAYRTSVKNILREFVGENFIIVDSTPVEKELKLEEFWDFSHLNSLGTAKMGKFLRREMGMDAP